MNDSKPTPALTAATPTAPVPIKQELYGAPVPYTPEYESLIEEKMQLCNFRREDAIIVIESQRTQNRLAGVKS